MNAHTDYQNANAIALLLAVKKKELSSEKKSILKDLAGNKGHEIIDPGMDEVDWTVSRNVIDNKLDTIGRIDSKIRSIDDALKHIDYGKFGVCQNCEKQIGIKRLLVIPHARFCIDCQNDLEQQSHLQRLVA